MAMGKVIKEVNYEEPAPACEARSSVEVTVDASLHDAAEHRTCETGGGEDRGTLAYFVGLVPSRCQRISTKMFAWHMELLHQRFY